jgi:hypothetical protein
LEHLIANGATNLGRVFGQLFELAMQLEREQYLRVNRCPAWISRSYTPLNQRPSFGFTHAAWSAIA